MPSLLEERDWRTLLKRIQSGRCTPIIGGGALGGARPYQDDIAGKWAKEYGYPLTDSLDLPCVAQFVAVEHNDPLVPKEEVIDLIKRAAPFDPNVEDDIHNVLARLPLPVYVTTNYDANMTKALVAQGKKPRRELCRWNRSLSDYPSVFDAEEGFEPDASNPVVYHLYGHDLLPESLVLTEDDHFDYLVNVSPSNQNVLPARILRALTGASLLFIGHQLDSMAFRVMFRGLIASMASAMRTLNIAVQAPPESEPHVEYLQTYYEDFANIRVKVYWGTAQKFARVLDERWKDFAYDA